MRNVRADDGRTLRVYADGDPSGYPVIVHHGTPASGRPFPPHVEDARRRGIRLIAYDRPGCGGSTPHPGRIVAEAAEDVRAIADPPWGFAVGAIRVPVLLWHGRHDLFVPFAHGEWLAGRIPGVDARLSDEDGHFTLFVRRVPEVHAWLLARA